MKTVQAIHELVNAAFRFFGGTGETETTILRARGGRKVIEEIGDYQLKFNDSDASHVMMPEAAVVVDLKRILEIPTVFVIGGHADQKVERLFVRYLKRTPIKPLTAKRRSYVGNYYDGIYLWWVFEITDY